MRPLIRVPVPPGAAGLTALIGPLKAALDGSGPAIAPIPTTSMTVSNEYVGRLIDAVRPDDNDYPLESSDVAAVLTTSGSMGSPRGVLLTADGLRALDPFVQTPDAVWIAALPITSMGGFNVVVRALATGDEPVALPSIGGAEPFTAAAFAAAVDSCSDRPVHVSLVTAQLRKLLADDRGTEALRACTRILIGAGPLPDLVREAAYAAGVQVTATYGATETSGGCVFNGVPLPGVRVQTTLGPEAVLVISGPMLAAGYRLEPGLTARYFTPMGFVTTDRGVVDEVGSVTVLGRIDDAVIIGGVNVSVNAVERIIEALPEVAAAAVIALAPDHGSTSEPQLVAFIDSAAPDLELEGLMSQAVGSGLGRAAIPSRIIRLGDRDNQGNRKNQDNQDNQSDLPMLPNGKVDRAALARWARESGPATWQH